MAELELKRLGRYELVRELGRGAMGVVYEGHDPVVDRRVAIKTARRDVVEGSTRADELMERFLREARSAGALSHPNIVTIFDAGEEQGTAYIAMEFLEGTDLQKLLDQNRRFSIEQILEITSTLCAALAHAHEHGIVHRDVKPANVVMLPDGRIKVADFGIARVTDSHLTQEGAIIGTPHYMSPEQFMGHAVDARSDIFSAGVIVYELLTGEKPFHGKTLSAVMHNVLHEMPVPPRQLNFAVTDCLSRVVMKALSKEPAHRYQAAGEMCLALKECLKDDPDPTITKVGVPSETLGLAETVRVSGEAETVIRATPEVKAPAAPRTLHAAGRLIQARREERGLILEQVHEASRVPERCLVALEEGDIRAFKDEEWPRVEGYIRACCEALGLDSGVAVGPFEAAWNKAREPRKRMAIRKWVGIGAAGVVVLLGLGVWSLVSEPEAPGSAQTGVTALPVAMLLGRNEALPSSDFYQEYRISIQHGLNETPENGVRVTLYAGDEKTGRRLESRVVDREVRVVIYDPKESLLTLESEKQGFKSGKLSLIVRGPDEVDKRVVQEVANITPLVSMGGPQ